jgi:peptide/nickel transport system substrate-binding protein
MASLRGLRVWLLAGSLLAGCSHASAPATGPLTIVQTQPVTKTVPGRQNGAVAQEMASLLHRYLITVDSAGRMVPDAALTVPSRANGGISSDGLSITYHLKAGLHFSDGSPLSGSDVVATLDALRSPGARIASRLGLDDVMDVSSPALLTVKVRLARPFAPILFFLCGPGNATVILPAHQATAVESSETPPEIVGAGPFRIRAFQAGERMELEPNPWYSPKPRVSELILRTVTSSETAHVQLQTGEAGGYVLADPAQAPLLADIAGLQIAVTPVDGIGALIFNTTAAPVADASTRHAIVDALDISGSVYRVFHGGVSTHDAPAGLFLWAYDPHAFPPPVYAPRTAAQLLDAAGWRAASDGRRYRNGAPLELTLIVRSDQPSSSILAATFAQALRSIGVTVTTRQYEINEWGSPDGPLYRGRFDLAIAQFVAGQDPDLTDQFACDRVPPLGYNKPRYCNPELDEVLRRAASTYDLPQRVALYRKAQEILARDLPMMPLYRLVTLSALPASVRGVEASPVTPFYNVANWRY